MAISIQILENFDEIQKKFEEFTDKVFTKSVRQAMNRSISGAKTEARKIAQSEFNLKAKAVNKRLFVRKASGNTLSSMQVSLHANTKPINLANFVKGVRRPKDFTGVPNRRRTPLRFEIRKGFAKRQKGIFLAVGKGGSVLAFRADKKVRRGSSGRMKAQSVKGISKILSEQSNRNSLFKKIRDRLGKELARLLTLNSRVR